MGVILRKRKNKNGSTTLMLDINHNGRRHYERLEIKLDKATTPTIRQENKERLELAKKIRLEREKELDADTFGVDTGAAKKIMVVDWMQTYIDNYQLADKRSLQGVLNRFKAFLKEKQLDNLTMQRLNENLITNFRDWLISFSIGEGAASYFSRFKKMVKAAYRSKLLPNNPAAEVKVKGRGNARKKDVLTIEEIKQLAATPTESNEVKQAFLFCCLTGLRWCDVEALTWDNINLTANPPYLKFRQHKTANDLKINLNSSTIKILETIPKRKGKIFELPTANGANKSLKAWVKRAGIDKKITWHNARHSFGTNLIYHDVDVLTASKLLGHRSLTHTQRYVRASEEMKQKAVEKLNIDL